MGLKGEGGYAHLVGGEIVYGNFYYYDRCFVMILDSSRILFWLVLNLNKGLMKLAGRFFWGKINSFYWIYGSIWALDFIAWAELKSWFSVRRRRAEALCLLLRAIAEIFPSREVRYACQTLLADPDPSLNQKFKISESNSHQSYWVQHL